MRIPLVRIGRQISRGGVGAPIVRETHAPKPGRRDDVGTSRISDARRYLATVTGPADGYLGHRGKALVLAVVRQSARGGDQDHHDCAALLGGSHERPLAPAPAAERRLPSPGRRRIPARLAEACNPAAPW